MNARARLLGLGALSLSFGTAARLLAADAGAPVPQLAPSAPSAAPAASTPSSPAALPAASPAADAGVEDDSGESCVPRVPTGKAAPLLKESIASRAQSGHALTLEVTVEHGKGETVLPTGFHVLSRSPEAKALERRGFVLPDPEGGAGPSLDRKLEGNRATTRVRISFVPLPDKPGRHELVLPPLPIAIARANGELMTLCTTPHRVLVEDPIANTPNPTPRKNPPPRPQREVWTTAKHVAYAAAIALCVGALSALLLGKWLRRPKKLPPPPPPRPPWEVALEALHDVRHAGLTKEGRFAEHFDRVSDAIRRYLGDRFGYDGLESTTREALSALRQARLDVGLFAEVEGLMREADLVKFARLTPDEPQCLDFLTRAERVVEVTIPPPTPAGPAPAAEPVAEEGAESEEEEPP